MAMVVPLNCDQICPIWKAGTILVPISYYRGDGSHKYVDVFDPKVKARLETGVRAVCLGIEALHET